MKALFEKIANELQTVGLALSLDLSVTLAAIRRHFLDHVGGELDAAKVLAFMARERFEDAASRGFPNHNAVELKANAIAAQAHADSLDIAAVLLPEPVVPQSPFDGYEMHYAKAGVMPTLAQSSESPLVIETVTYADGSTATGPAPLPRQSPEEQAALISPAPDAAATPDITSVEPVADTGAELTPPEVTETIVLPFSTSGDQSQPSESSEASSIVADASATDTMMGG